MRNLICLTFLILCCPVCLSQFGGLNIDSNTIKQIPPQTIALLLADFLAKQPKLLYGLADVGLAALPLITGQPSLKPEITSSFLQWGLESLPKLVKNEKVVQLVQLLKNEINKVNVTGLNQSDYNAVMNTVFSKLDWPGMAETVIMKNPDFVENLLITVADPFIARLNLNPRITGHLVPWVMEKIPDLLVNTLPKLLHIVVDELNNVNVTEFNMTDNNVFVSQLFMNFNFIRLIQTFLTQNPVSYYLPQTAASTSLGLTDVCYYQTMGMFDNLFNGSNWALKMLDALGKPPTGILKGGLHFIGQYDECLAVKGDVNYVGLSDNVTTTLSRTFNGRYCRATFHLPSTLVESLIGKVDTHGISTDLTLGLCLPDTCEKRDVSGLLHIGILDNFGLSPVSVVCSQDYNLAEDDPAIVIIVVMAIIVALVMLCTVIHILISRNKSESLNGKPSVVYINKSYVTDNGTANGIPPKSDTDDENGEDVPPEINGHIQAGESVGESEVVAKKSSLGRLLVKAFSFHSNFSQIMSVDMPTDSIECIYGIRFVSMVMIMIGNSYIYNVLSLAESPVSGNLLDALDMLQRFTFQVILSASYDTDTFLMISGCLVTYRLVEKVRKIGSFRIKTWLGFYFHRYWRITPAYMIVMMAFSCMYHYIGHGPLWPENIYVGDECKTTWWHNILYVNNLIDHTGKDAYHQCMPWSWQLAVVMQFYLITPILVIFFVMSKYLGAVIVSLLMVAGIVSAGFKEHRYGGDLMTMSTDGGAYWNNVFIKPWCRVAAYCVGVLLAFILAEYKRDRKCNKIVAVIGWILSLVTACTFIFITYTKNREDGIPWTSVQQAVYESVGRPAWAASVAWIVFACFTGVGGFVNSFLSWRGFVPLSRLTYSVYLLNPILMVLYVYSKRTLVYLSDFDMVYLFFGHLLMSYLIAIPIAATFEYPFIRLERALKKRI